MKFLVAFAVAVACASADVSHIVKPTHSDGYVPIVRSEYDITPEGGFQYTYEAANGIFNHAEGVINNVNGEPAQEVKGVFKYTSPDGTPVELNYIANENGYQPQGSHLPVGPAIPEAIARSLAYIAAHPQKAESVPKAVYAALG